MPSNLHQIHQALKRNERFYQVRKTPTGIVFVKRGEPQYNTLDQRFKITIVSTASNKIAIRLWVYKMNKYEPVRYYDSYNSFYDHIVSSTKRDARSTAVYLKSLD